MRRTQAVSIGTVMGAVARPTTLANTTSFLAASGTISGIETWRTRSASMRRRGKEWMIICEMTCTICVTLLVVGRVSKGSSAVVLLMYTTHLSGSLERRRGTSIRVQVQVCRSVRVIYRGSSQVCFEVSCLTCYYYVCQSATNFVFFFLTSIFFSCYFCHLLSMGWATLFSLVPD